MTDKELQQLLPDYLAGRLDPTVRQEIEERLAVSDTLRTALEEAKRYAAALEALEPEYAPDDFLEKVHARIEAKRGLFDYLFRPFHIKLPVECAGVAAAVILVVIVYHPFSGRVPKHIAESEKSAGYASGMPESTPSTVKKAKAAPGSPLAEIVSIIEHHNGSVDTVLEKSAQQLTLKISVPKKKRHRLRSALAKRCTVLSFKIIDESANDFTLTAILTIGPEN